MNSSGPARLVVMIFFLVGVAQPQEPAKGEEELNAHLAELHHEEGVDEAAIQKWFDEQMKKQRGDSVRVFPWCFGPNNPPKNLPQVFHDMMDQGKIFNPKRDSWKGYIDSGNNGIDRLMTEITFKRVSVKAATVKPNIFQGEEGKNPEVMNGWTNFLVKFKRPIRYFYVQSIGLPLGTPVGEFVDVRFTCNDGASLDQGNYESITKLIPCQFAPKSSYWWPNVFIMETPANGPVDKIQFRFRHTESHCYEMSYFQFILAAQEKAGASTHDVVLSPIYKRFTVDSSVPLVPHPYHPFHDKRECATDFDQKRVEFVEASQELRIKSNKQFDGCVEKESADTSGVWRNRCPPGPFKCHAKWTTIEEAKKLGEEWYKKLVGPPCCKLHLPFEKPTTTTTSPPTEAPSAKNQTEQQKAFQHRATRVEIHDVISHGDYLILAWLILIPTADIVSRFFKEFGEIRCVGMGFWVLIHTVLHITGLFLTWWSIGFVMGSTSEDLDRVTIQHYVLGGMCVIFQMFQFITGLRRSITLDVSYNWVFTHAWCGHINQGMGFAAMLLSGAGQERKLVSLGLLMSWAIAFFAFTMIERRQDQAMGMDMHRAHCPVLNRIVIDAPRKPPFWKEKIFFLVLYILVEIFMFAVMVMIHSQEHAATKKLSALKEHSS